MKKSKMIRMIGVLMCVLMLFNLAACGKKPGTEPAKPTDPIQEPVNVVSKDLMEGIVAAAPVTYGKPSEASLKAAISFGTRLAEKCLEKDKNTLISPLSVIMALGMTANGAKGLTLEQMEKIFGLKQEDVNLLLGSLIEALSQDQTNSLKIANAIWFKDEDDFVPNADFLQKNADVFKASIYKAPFDVTTLNDINNWVKAKTEGMIENILDQIPPDAVMYLVNALAFDAKWSKGYLETEVREGVFTNSDGSVKKTDFMYSHEGTYIKSKTASGFQKYYENGRYSFIALLPDEGHTTEEVIAELSTILENFEAYKNYRGVDTYLPKFRADFIVELSEALAEMGMDNAFTDKADFENLGTCPQSGLGLHISRVLHKTFIEVTESGTRAGAATVVEMAKNTAVMEPEVVPVVRLDRPFVYMLYDNETGMPFFIGVENMMK